MNTVVVTGAAQGVGLATASLLARSARVILLDLQPMDAQVVRLRAAGAEVACLSGDISSEAFVQQAAQWMHGEYGPIDGLVNAWSTHGSLALAISGTTVAAYALVIAAAWALPETCGRALVADPA
jgi:NAD(P)-dependent dehydrogenase (short-subunit alcohol dehydrogenase family)